MDSNVNNTNRNDATPATPNPIKAPGRSKSRYQIMCPYCFNRANGGHGNYIGDDEVAFRAETAYHSVRDIEKLMGTTEDDIELMPANERPAVEAQFSKYKRFLVGTSAKYQAFWNDYNGSTEVGDSANKAPWELPVIQVGDGVAELKREQNSGFVNRAIDEFGKETTRRVCPFCNNPLPKGYGKFPVKYISIIGATHSGKTVYISQLLKGMWVFAEKAALTANFTAHELDFIEQNKVEANVPLPDATTKEKFSQPMFYDITKTEGVDRTTNTIVLYDIAGENCRSASDIEKFAKYVMQSDGIILLIDPKQLGFIPGEQADSKSLEEVFSTIHGAIADRDNEPSRIPLAVCISKSDMCFDILPAEASEQVRAAGQDAYGFNLPKFNSTSHNTLISGSNGLAALIQKTAASACQALRSEFLNFNFFALSAIGCEVAPGPDGRDRPVHTPDPIRIEEPILWLFRFFGYIGSNEKTLRPFPIPHGRRYVKKGVFSKKLEPLPQEDSKYEEDTVRRFPQVQRKKNGPWEMMTPDELELIGRG